MTETPDYEKLLVKRFEGLRGAALLAAPVYAIAGVSEADAEALRASIGVATIGDLATNPFVRVAHLLSAAASASAPARTEAPSADGIRVEPATGVRAPDPIRLIGLDPSHEAWTVWYRSVLSGVGRRIHVVVDPTGSATFPCPADLLSPGREARIRVTGHAADGARCSVERVVQPASDTGNPT